MARNEELAELVKRDICPVCKNRLVHMEGCVECEFCGWSTCEEA